MRSGCCFFYQFFQFTQLSTLCPGNVICVSESVVSNFFILSNTCLNNLLFQAFWQASYSNSCQQNCVLATDQFCSSDYVLTCRAGPSFYFVQIIFYSLSFLLPISHDFPIIINSLLHQLGFNVKHVNSCPFLDK